MREDLGSNLRAKEYVVLMATSAPPEDGVCFDRNHLISPRKVMCRVVAVVHADVENSTVTDLWLLQQGNGAALWVTRYKVRH